MHRQSFLVIAAGLAVGLGLAQVAPAWGETGAVQLSTQSQAAAVSSKVSSAGGRTPVMNKDPLRFFLGWKALTSGAAFFGAAYAATAITAAAVNRVCAEPALECPKTLWSLSLPVAAAFKQAGNLGSDGDAAKAVLAMEEVGQGGSVGGAIANAIADAQERATSRRCTVVPQLGIGSVGLIALGRF